jgi:hypothetical protein
MSAPGEKGREQVLLVAMGMKHLDIPALQEMHSFQKDRREVVLVFANDSQLDASVIDLLTQSAGIQHNCRKVHLRVAGKMTEQQSHLDFCACP